MEVGKGQTHRVMEGGLGKLPGGYGGDDGC